jgi:phage gp36-like protein
VLAFGIKEAIQLSNLDNPSANSVNTERIWMAIQDAVSLIDSYIAQAPRANKLLISSSRRRVALVFARYYLDSVRRREDVTADYERAIKELDTAMQAPYIKPEADCGAGGGNLPAINNGGIIRSWRIPQYYNGVSGKGLSGWWTDSGADENADWKEAGFADETNNDESNWEQGNKARIPVQPGDSGGQRQSGNSNI